MKQVGIWVAITVITVVTIWGLIAFVNSTPAPTQISKTGTPSPVNQDDITLGATESAQVTLIEYADYECPACATYTQFVKQADKDFGNNLLIAYRFFPLVNIHKNAMPSAQAAYAAHKQGKFWEMSELLYKNQDAWAKTDNALEVFIQYAKELGLNSDQFATDYNADSTRQFIEKEQQEGFSINITYTPSIFINGKLIKNPKKYEDFKQLIQNEINDK